MLCSRPYRNTNRDTDNAKPLVQSISSATSIIALYDLFRRTFGDCHVVLCLAYSLYTAASIFLLEIQALKYASSGTIEKLRYCIAAMHRVTAANPGKFEKKYTYIHMCILRKSYVLETHTNPCSSVINTALGLIDQELKKLGVNINGPSSHTQQPVYIPPPGQISPSSSSVSQAPYTLPPHGAFSYTPPPPPEQMNQANLNMDPNLPIPATLKQEDVYDIAPELFEAFSYVDPLSAAVGAVGTEFESGWENPTM